MYHVNHVNISTLCKIAIVDTVNFDMMWQSWTILAAKTALCAKLELTLLADILGNELQTAVCPISVISLKIIAYNTGFVWLWGKC